MRLLLFSSIIFSTLLLCACNSKQNNPVVEDNKNQSIYADSSATSTKKPDSAKLIIPGKSIGLTRIYENADSVFQILGKPDSSDAAMGKMMASWYRNNHETHIFFSRNMGNADESSRVKQIRITSPYFITANGISVGSALDSINQYFPNAKNAASYISPKTKKEVIIYDDLKGGVAFEIDTQKKCIGINIHKPNEEAYETYIAFFSSFKKF